MRDPIVKRAVEAAGGPAKLAEALGCKPQAISQWQAIPPARVLKIEEITGIPRWILRPDWYPRDNASGRPSAEVA